MEGTRVPKAVTGHSIHDRRFHHSLTDHGRWIRERSHESYSKNYSVVFPHDEPLAGRNMRTDPLHEVPPPPPRSACSVPAAGALREPQVWGDRVHAAPPRPQLQGRCWLLRSLGTYRGNVPGAQWGVVRARCTGRCVQSPIRRAGPGSGVLRRRAPACGACLGCLSSPASFYLYDETHRQVAFPGAYPWALSQAPDNPGAFPVLPLPPPTPSPSPSPLPCPHVYEDPGNGGWAPVTLSAEPDSG